MGDATTYELLKNNELCVYSPVWWILCMTQAISSERKKIFINTQDLP